MSYIQIDFNKVEGFDTLSDTAQMIFKRVYKIHNSSQGIDYKNEYIPISVKEHKKYLEVYFINGSWLHYLPSGEWY